MASKKIRTHSLVLSYDTNFYHWPETNNQTPSNNLSRANLFEEKDLEFEPLLFDQFNKAESITFTAEIEVLEHYDHEDELIVEESQWKSHYKADRTDKLQEGLCTLSHEQSSKQQHQTNEQISKQQVHDEVEELRVQNEEYREKISLLAASQSTVEQQIENLQAENQRLIAMLAARDAERKIFQVQIDALKQQIDDMNRIDPSAFMHWDSGSIARWICALENGRYKKYHSSLSAVLQESEMVGSDLLHVNQQDIKEWGIKSFKDKKCLLDHIEKLIVQYGVRGTRRHRNGFHSKKDSNSSHISGSNVGVRAMFL